MKIRILGSAAAECMPAIWCECDTCKQARINRGKDVRRRTSYLLDDDTLIDMGPDFFGQLIEFKIDERKLKRIIFTHRHEDHLSPMELFWRKQWYSIVSGKIRLFGGNFVFTRIAATYGLLNAGFDYNSDLSLDSTVLHHGELTVDDDVSILPMNANHDPARDPFVYVISRNGKKVFICNDTGLLPENSMKVCAGANVDLLIIDCTMGFANPDNANGHLGVNSVLTQIERFRANGTIRPDTKIVTNHFSHNGHGLHSDLETFFNPKGIEVGFDGKEIEF